MRILKLQIENFRNITAATIEPHPSLNLIHGDNGAGKTSILESIVVLAKGRSFRSTQAGELIRLGKERFSVYAETSDEDRPVVRLGLERSKADWRARRNGVDLQQISELAEDFPLIVMEPNSHLLVSGSPEVRRKYLDWGVFHVEHGFLVAWRRYARALKQRNAALRSGQHAALEGIEVQLVGAAKIISEARQSYTDSLSAPFRVNLAVISPNSVKIELRYRRGWSGPTLKESLDVALPRDRERGMTGPGPHRADLGLVIDGVSARHHLSRGEQKSVAAALLLAQVDRQVEHGAVPVILLDDLASEFDDKHMKAVLQQALASGAQIWSTGTTCDDPGQPHKMFHVEHGVVSEMV